MDTLIHFCFSSRVRVYTKKLVKVATFFIWVYPSVRKVALVSHFLVIFKMRDTLPPSNKFQDFFLFAQLFGYLLKFTYLVGIKTLMTYVLLFFILRLQLNWRYCGRNEGEGTFICFKNEGQISRAKLTEILTIFPHVTVSLFFVT